MGVVPMWVVPMWTLRGMAGPCCKMASPWTRLRLYSTSLEALPPLPLLAMARPMAESSEALPPLPLLAMAVAVAEPSLLGLEALTPLPLLAMAVAVPSLLGLEATSPLPLLAVAMAESRPEHSGASLLESLRLSPQSNEELRDSGGEREEGGGAP